METLQINYNQLKRSNWTQKEDKNVRLVIDFMQQLMNNHDFDLVRKHFVNSQYKQHNRNLPDGMEALIQYIQKFTKQYPKYTYDVKRIHADGDYVIFHSHITTSVKDRGNDKKGINASDTWRIENGQIVEHWDTLQPMNGLLRFVFWLIGGKIENNNGVF